MGAGTRDIHDLAAHYMNDVGRYPVMSSEEFDRLIPRAQKGDRDAVNRIVQGNLRFVVQIASEYNQSVLPFADLLAEGNLGLIKAVERFDPSLGYRFSTYAVWWIRNAIQRAVRQQSHPYRLPHNRLDDLSRIQRTVEQVAQETGRDVSAVEAAEILGMNARRTELALAARRGALSLDDAIDEDADRSLHAVLPDDAPLPDDELFQAEITMRLRNAMGHLKSRDAEIVRLTFGLDDEPLTLTEVGARFGISKERVRQLRNRAMNQLRAMMGGEQELAAA